MCKARVKTTCEPRSVKRSTMVINFVEDPDGSKIKLMEMA